MALVVKNLPANRRHKRCEFNLWFGKISWSGKWQPTPVFLPGKSLGREAWLAIVHGVEKSVMTEHAHTQTGNQSITIAIVNALDPCFPFHIRNAVPFSVESLKLVLSHVLKASKWNY